MPSQNFSFEIGELKKLITNSKRVVFFTGAGISTESGISDYRSQGGIYERYRPVTIQEFLSDDESKKEFWKRKNEFYGQLAQASPNPAHIAIARLEKEKKAIGVITQNIDGLHQSAGSENVIEIHGTNLEIVCLNCSQKTTHEQTYRELYDGIEIPRCKSCDGYLKTNTISFGQQMDFSRLEQAFKLTKECDLMIAVGSSLVVEPAASIPRKAKEFGAKLVIINKETTPLYVIADLNIGSFAGNILGQI